MNRPDPYQRHEYPYANWLWGVVIPLLLTAIDWPFRALLTPSNILMVSLLGVFFVAIRFGLWPSIIASLISAAAFAFFFAQPIFSFAIADPENLFGVTVMLVVGIVTSKLAENMRTQTKIAEHREHQASALYQLSQELAGAHLGGEIMVTGVQHIHAEFGGRNTFLFPNQSGHLCYPNEPVLDSSWQGANLVVAQWAFKNARIAGQCTNTFSNDPALYLPLKSSTGTIGVLAIEVVDYQPLFNPGQRQFLDTFVNQIIHSLERVQLAEQAKDATLKMQAETLRNSLLSSISHDLRTPLATILGAASTLETDVHLNESSKRKLVGAISEEAQRMADLTTKILEMARLEAGEVVLNRQWNAPEELIGSALRRLDKQLKNRLVEVNMADDLPLIYVDAVLLQQVLINLLDNADKYSPAGLAIDVVVATTSFELSIIVMDRGSGIPIEMQQKIFDKFFRIQPESAQGGVGLGLAICRAIVEAHGGEIRVSNRSGGGAVFHLHLPILEAPPSIESEEQGYFHENN